MYDDVRLKRRAQFVFFGACLAIFFSAFEVRQPVFTLGTIGVTTTELAVGLFFLSAAAWAEIDRSSFFSRRALDLAVIFFLLSNYASAAFSVDQSSAFKFSLRMTFAALVYFAISRLPARARSHLVVSGAITVTMLTVTLIGLMQQFIPGIDWPELLSPWQEGITTFGNYYNIRIAATLPFPTVLSMYLELSLPVGVALGLWLIGRDGNTKGRKKLWQSVTVIGVIAVMVVQVYTYTRSTLMATTASMLTAAALALVYGYSRRVATYFAAIVLVMAAVMGATVILSETAADRYGVGDVSRRYEAEYKLLEFPETLTVGQDYSAVLQVVNTSDIIWLKSGSDSFMVISRWVDYPQKEHLDDEYSVASELPVDMAPGESSDVSVAFKTPRTPGRYVFVTELYKSHVGVLSAAGVAPVVVPVEFDTGGGSIFKIPETPEMFNYVDTKQNLVSRPILWRAALDMWKSKPLLGIGPGQFRNEYPNYVPGIRSDARIEANNIFLEALANTGLAGLITMIFLLASALFYQFRLVRDRLLGWSTRLLALGLLAAMVAYIVHGVLDFFLWQNGVSILFFTQMGLTAWLVDRAKRSA